MFEAMLAQSALRLPTNVPGDFFVDGSCIDCDACRQIAPSIFHDTGDQSAVHHQPENAAELLAAQKALVACPTASIGSEERHSMVEALGAYPEVVEENVYRCGYTSEKSFGAFSYLIQRPDGNVLVDSPRFSGPLIKRLEAMGGVSTLLLTHADDVADHQKFHDRFGCRRVLHRSDISRSTAAIEWQPIGPDPVQIAPDLLMIPTPGHTRGHVVYLYREKFLFTGDHLAWNENRDTLYAFRNACWYSWEEQIRSMESLLPYRFDSVLPGHGRPKRLTAVRMHEELLRCVEWMIGVSSS